MNLLSKKYIYPHDYGVYNVRESVTVCEQHGFDVIHYQAGRCHLMALVMAAESEMHMGVFIDQYAFEDEDCEPRQALDHAFCYHHDGENLIDVRGMRGRKELMDEYCANSNDPVEIGGDEAKILLETWIREGLLVDFLPGEREAILRYVKAMKDHDLFVLHDFGVTPPEFDTQAVSPFFS